MKRLIGWLANFYPNHIFYSSRFGEDEDFSLTGNPGESHGTHGRTALMVVCVSAGRNLQPGGRMSGEFTGVTDKGRDVGTFRIVIDRLPDRAGQRMSSEARYDDDGSLDEVMAENVYFHLEQLDTGAWWIGLTHSDGTVDHITLSTKRGAKVTGRFEADA